MTRVARAASAEFRDDRTPRPSGQSATVATPKRTMRTQLQDPWPVLSLLLAMASLSNGPTALAQSQPQPRFQPQPQLQPQPQPQPQLQPEPKPQFQPQPQLQPQLKPQSKPLLPAAKKWTGSFGRNSASVLSNFNNSNTRSSSRSSSSSSSSSSNSSSSNSSSSTSGVDSSGSSVSAAGQPQRLSVGLLVPHTTFKVRMYSSAVSSALNSLVKQDLSFLHSYEFRPADVHIDMIKINPSPTGKFFFNIMSPFYVWDQLSHFLREISFIFLLKCERLS